MATMIESKSKTRKEWVAPELKKVSVEEITAKSAGGSDDGNQTGGGGTKS